MLREVTAALDGHLATMSGLPDVAWHNISFEPDSSAIHLQVSMLPADGTLYSITHQQDTPGIYQVSVAAPVGDGPGAAQEMADKVRDHFASNRLINGVHIEAINFGPAQIEEQWYIIPVSIDWRYFD